MAPKDIDIAIYGATGYTGKLCAEHLLKSPDVRIALAGRSRAKVEAVQLAYDPSQRSEIIVAEDGDAASLRRLCARSRVVLSLVGPYASRGAGLIEACIAEGSHYLDVTAETLWVRDMIARYENQAREAGVLIIHSVGSDSLPYDLTTLEAARELERSAGKRQLARVRTSMAATGGGFSGGACATVLDALAKPSELVRLTYDKYMLSPKKGRQTVRGPILWSSERQGFGGFWILGAHNDAIVQRTWGVLEQEHDADPSAFSYGDSIDVGNFIKMPDPVSPLLLSGVIMLVCGSAAILPPVRWALARYGPQSGDGPSEATREKTRTAWTTIASSVDKKTTVQSTLSGKSDPGYGLTSIMAVEAALALILNKYELPDRTKQGGFLTSALAFDSVLGKRLVDTGMFTLETRTLD